MKKINGILGLLAILLLLVHVVYQAIAFLIFYYNPIMSKLMSWGFLIVAALHALLSLWMVCFSHESKTVLYPRQNIRTMVQRISGIGLLVLSLAHIKMFSLLGMTAGSPAMAGVILVEILFFILIYAHVAASFTRALITLGWLQSRKTQRTLDRCLWTVLGLGILAAAVIIIRTQLIMFGR